MRTGPEAIGQDHAVASTHWLATSIGAEVLARGGNAADAATATGFALQVLEPHLNGPGGEAPIIVDDGAARHVIDGQGTAPAGATIAHYRAEGLDLVPGTGLLAACVPGAFAAWATLLERWGTWELADVLAPALGLAERGFPLLERASRTIGTVAAHFAAHWPSSAAVWLEDDGGAPAPNARWRLPALAATWRRLLDEASSAPSREARIAAARDAWYRGFVAEEIGAFAAGTEAMDSSGARHRGVLAADDLARWSVRVEEPLSARYGDWTVHKTGYWGQGPVFLQQLQLLDAAGLHAMEYRGPDYLHTLVEASKLAFADREAWYGDPRFTDVPDLLADGYARDRAALIGPEASGEQRPGSPGGRSPVLPDFRAAGAPGAVGVGEPTVGAVAHPGAAASRAAVPVSPDAPACDGATRGDTCHLDATDASGLTVSATPSGGWLQSSPAIPALGFCLGTRAQVFWLQEGLPTSLRPGARPRTTLSPALAVHGDGTRLAFGTPGGDQQDQWALAWFLSVVHGPAADGVAGRRQADLQWAMDEPMLHHLHLHESFAPRGIEPRAVVAEPRLGDGVLAALAARGHDVRRAADWSLGRTTAVSGHGPDGFVRAAANARGAQGQATAR